MENLKIKTPKGEVKNIKIKLFDAMDGWVLQHRFIEFASSNDIQIRRQYTVDVLAYAVVVLDTSQEIPLTTDALIDNHLQTWQNVSEVFDEILKRNGIDPKTHADKPDYWAEAGSIMATHFVAECAKLMGPAFISFENGLKAQ